MIKFATWEELAQRLELRADSVDVLGGFNGLGAELRIAAEYLRLLSNAVTELDERERIGGY